MLKADLLRQQISQSVPWAKKHPDKVAVYVEKGSIVCTGQQSASFMYRYTLTVLVMDYPGDTDSIMIAVLAWARLYQPELLFNPQRYPNGITFDADLLSNNTMDVKISIQADEAVTVTSANGVIAATHIADAMPQPGDDADGWSLIAQDVSDLSS